MQLLFDYPKIKIMTILTEFWGFFCVGFVPGSTRKKSELRKRHILCTHVRENGTNQKLNFGGIKYRHHSYFVDHDLRVMNIHFAYNNQQ